MSLTLDANADFMPRNLSARMIQFLFHEAIRCIVELHNLRI
jgi:hypothetical protein